MSDARTATDLERQEIATAPWLSIRYFRDVIIPQATGGYLKVDTPLWDSWEDHALNDLARREVIIRLPPRRGMTRIQITGKGQIWKETLKV